MHLPQTAAMDWLLPLALAGLLASGVMAAWLAWRESARRRALHALMDAADALEGRLREARSRLGQRPGQPDPVQAALGELLQHRLWLRDHGAGASLRRLADVRAGIEGATRDLEAQLQQGG